MNTTDVSFEARGILQQLRKRKNVEAELRVRSRLGWGEDALERAGTFVKRMNDTKASLPPTPRTRCRHTHFVSATAVDQEQIKTRCPDELNRDHTRRTTPGRSCRH